MMQQGLRRRSLKRFSAASILIYALAALIGAGRLTFDETAAHRAGRSLGYGVSADLVLTVPILFWWFLLSGPRRRAWWSSAGAAWSACSLAAAGWLAAGWVLPTSQVPSFVAASPGRILAAVTLAGGALHLFGWMTATDGVFDPLDRVHSRLRSAMGSGVIARAVTAVLAPGAIVFGLALASWRHAPGVPEGMRAFSQHRRSLHGEMLLGLLLASTAEVLAMHFLVARWSAGAAWVLTMLSLYGSLWLIADYRAAVLRPVLLGAGTVRIRAGLRFDVDVQLANIERVDGERPDAPSMALTMLSEPEQWLIFREPVVAKGPYGIRRAVAAVGVTVDGGAEFAAEIVRTR